MYNEFFELNDSKNGNKRGFEVFSSWKSDYGDVRYNCVLYEDKKPIANVIISLEIYWGLEAKKQVEVLKDHLDYSFGMYKGLPTLDRCSKLLQEIYDTVANSDNEMCHIDKDDWKELCEKYNYTNDDLIDLEEEVGKLALKDVVTINEDNYVIVGYGDLPTRFNDNRRLYELKEEDLSL